MRVVPAAFAAVLALATPSVAHAEDVWEDAPESELADLSDRLSDPVFQAQAATLAQIFLGTMLDLEIGPFAEAVNRATDGAGPDIAPDARVRDLAPDAENLPEEVGERLPAAMDSMAIMADGMQQMIPSFLDMAERMRDAMEQARMTAPQR